MPGECETCANLGDPYCVMISNYSVLSPFGFDPPPVPVNVRPWPRKVSQKERRKKARYRRSQGIKGGK